MTATPAGNPPEPAGLYLHVPFCRSVCPYCDFAVTVARPAAYDEFATSLVREIGSWSRWAIPFDTVYLGGGTPSALPYPVLSRILDAVRARLPVTGDARIFIEANPEDVTAEVAAGWRRLGIDVVSLGVQSFDDSELRFLGRHHTGDEGKAAVRACRDAGFHTVSVDVIFGLPGQGIEALERTLDALGALAPAHVSCYQLTVHEGTAFGRRRDRGRLREMPEAAQADSYRHLVRRLRADGLVPYEASNFARGPRHRSRHNLKYWHHVPYLGLGPAAHSFDGADRWWNERDLVRYSTRARAGEKPIAGRESLGPADLALEAVMLSVRTVEGIDLVRFRERFGFDLRARNRALFDAWAEAGLVTLADDRLMPTIDGLAVADGLASRIEIAEPS